jgi:hypothetical protein
MTWIKYLRLIVVPFANTHFIKIKSKFNATNLNDLSDKFDCLIEKAMGNAEVLRFLRITFHFTHFVLGVINEWFHLTSGYGQVLTDCQMFTNISASHGNALRGLCMNPCQEIWLSVLVQWQITSRVSGGSKP